MDKVKAISLETLAGNNIGGYLDGPRGAARLWSPSDMVYDSEGNLFVVDEGSRMIRKVLADGTITSFVGSPAYKSEEDGSGIYASFYEPRTIAIDHSDNLYVADRSAIRKITPEGLVSTLAGEITEDAYIDGIGTEARFYAPQGIFYSSLDHSLLIADTHNHRIRKLNLNTLEVTTIAGSGSAGLADGIGINSMFYHPSGIFQNLSGEIFISSLSNHAIRKIYQGDSGLEVETIIQNAGLNAPRDIVGDSENNLYISDTNNHQIKKLFFNGASWEIETLVGKGLPGAMDGNPDLASLRNPFGLILNTDGDLLIADRGGHMIRLLDFDGTYAEPEVSTYLGYTRGDVIEGDRSTGAFHGIGKLITDSSNNIFLTDFLKDRILKISDTGELTIVAGGNNFKAGEGNTAGFQDGLKASALFNGSMGISLDNLGNLYVADTENHSIRKITTDGNVTTLTGNGNAGFKDGTLSEAQFNRPHDLAFDSHGNLFVTDFGNHRVRMIDKSGNVTTIVGHEQGGHIDGVGEAARISSPYGISINSSDEIFVSDLWNSTIRKITKTELGNWLLSTYAGTPVVRGYIDSQKNQARFANPMGLYADNEGNVFVADQENNAVRVIKNDGFVETVAGTGVAGFLNASAEKAILGAPRFLAMDSYGNLLVGDTQNHKIRKINSSVIDLVLNSVSENPPPTESPSEEPFTISSVAGLSGRNGYRDGTYLENIFNQPFGMNFDSEGNLYLADTYNHTIRKLDNNFKATTIAGQRTAGDLDAKGFDAQFNQPRDLVIDSHGNLFVADLLNHKIKKITPDGTVSTFAGNGSEAWIDGQGINSSFNRPSGLAIDDNDNIFVADDLNYAIRKISPDGTVTTIAGGIPGSLDGKISIAKIGRPIDLVIDSEGNIIFSQLWGSLIRKIDFSSDQVITLAGNNLNSFKDGFGIDSSLNRPYSLCLDSQDNLYVADRENHRIRKLDKDGKLTTVAGYGLALSYDGLALSSGTERPTALAIKDGELYFADASSRIRKLSQTPLAPDPETIILEVEKIIEVEKEIIREIITEVIVGGSNNSVPNREPVLMVINEVEFPLEVGEGLDYMIRVFAYDPDEAKSLKDSISWTSDKQGLLANGTSFNTAILELGTHEIQVSVSDSSGLTKTIFLDIIVKDPSVIDGGGVITPNAVGNAAIKLFPPKRAKFRKGKKLRARALAINILDENAENIEDISDQIIWKSNLNGEIGSGKRLKINTRRLKKGLHTISAEVNGTVQSFEIEIKAVKKSN